MVLKGEGEKNEERRKQIRGREGKHSALKHGKHPSSPWASVSSLVRWEGCLPSLRTSLWNLSLITPEASPSLDSHHPPGQHQL